MHQSAKIKASALVCAVLLASCSSAPLAETQPLPELAAPLAHRQRLAPNDLVQVIVVGHPDLSSPEEGTRVDAEGKLHLPLAGTVEIAGLTSEEARDAVQLAFARFVREPTVGFAVVEYALRPVYILGDVDVSGAYDLERPLTALQAVSLAGGFRVGADRDRIALFHLEDEEYVVTFFSAATPGPDGLVPVAAGDVIFVRQSGAGTFNEQVMPYIRGIALPITAIASFVIASEAIND